MRRKYLKLSFIITMQMQVERMGNNYQRGHKDSNVVNALIQVSVWIAEPKSHMVTSKKGSEY